MKTRVSEICKQRGLSLKWLSDQIGVKQSNLVQSLKGNPTIGSLKAIADVLGVKISELFEEQVNDVSGFLEVEGKIKKIQSRKDLIPIVGTFGIPTYVSYKVCKKDLNEFLKKRLDKYTEDVFAAFIDGTVLINVFKTRDNEVDPDIADTCFNYYLSLYTSDGRKYTYTFDGISYSDGKGGIDYRYLLLTLWAEVIGCIDPSKDYEGTPEMEKFALDEV